MSNRAQLLVLAWVVFFVGCTEILNLRDETMGLAGSTTSSSGSPGGTGTSSTTSSTTGTGAMGGSGGQGGADGGTGGGGSDAGTTSSAGSGGGTMSGSGGADAGTVGLLWTYVDPHDGWFQRVALDPAGNPVIVGWWGVSPQTSSGGSIVVTKPLGPATWSRSFSYGIGALGFDTSWLDVAVDATGEVLVAGWAPGPINFGGNTLPAKTGFVAKLDAGGNHLWSKSFGNGGANSVAVDAAGNVLVTGWVGSSINFGGTALSCPQGCAFVAKLNPGGGELWHNNCGRPSNASEDFVDRLAVDAAGNIVVAGGFQGFVDFGGGAVASVGSVDMFAAKLDPSGGHVWTKSWGMPGTSVAASAVAVDSADMVILTGGLDGSVGLGGMGGTLTSASAQDSFAAKLDPSGNALWGKTFGAEQLNSEFPAPSVAVDGNGNVWLTGNIDGSANFGGGALLSGANPGAFAAYLDPSGNYRWAKNFPPSASEGLGIAVDGAGNAVVVGGFQDSIDLGAGPLTAQAPWNGFAAKFSP
jgi:hypothetical protein